MAVKLLVHPAFYRRLRHYRDRIKSDEGRPQTATRFVNAVTGRAPQLMASPGSGHSAGFQAPDLADILRTSVPGFPIFSIFYRSERQTLTLITVEHTAQDLPARLASILAKSGR